MKPEKEDVLTWQMKLVEEVNFLKNQRAELEAKLEKAKDALKYYASHPQRTIYGCDCYTCDNGDEAREALKEIK